MVQVTRLLLTNQNALFHYSISSYAMLKMSL